MAGFYQKTRFWNSLLVMVQDDDQPIARSRLSLPSGACRAGLGRGLRLAFNRTCGLLYRLRISGSTFLRWYRLLPRCRPLLRGDSMDGTDTYIGKRPGQVSCEKY
jgi:hypothetical protein